jgi:hypothetical protein
VRRSRQLTTGLSLLCKKSVPSASFGASGNWSILWWTMRARPRGRWCPNDIVFSRAPVIIWLVCSVCGLYVVGRICSWRSVSSNGFWLILWPLHSFHGDQEVFSLINPLGLLLSPKSECKNILVIVRLYWNPITMVLIWKVLRQAFRWYHYIWNPSIFGWVISLFEIFTKYRQSLKS